MTPEPRTELASLLEPTETELLNVAAALKEGADRVESLSLWYGRAQLQVPRALRKVESDEQWSRMQELFRMKRVTQIEPLHDEHAVEAYRHAWEAWLLAPATKEKNTLLPRAHQAIAKVANPQSLPLLVTAFKDAVRDRDMSYASPIRDTHCWALIYTIHSFKSEEALLALLECREVGIKAGVERGTAIYFAQDKSFDESFVRLITSTRHDPEAPPFNEIWKVYLPHIETQLKRKDLTAETRKLLKQIAQPLRSRIKAR